MLDVVLPGDAVTVVGMGAPNARRIAGVGVALVATAALPAKLAVRRGCALSLLDTYALPHADLGILHAS